MLFIKDVYFFVYCVMKRVDEMRGEERRGEDPSLVNVYSQITKPISEVGS